MAWGELAAEDDRTSAGIGRLSMGKRLGRFFFVRKKRAISARLKGWVASLRIALDATLIA